jgi:membrane-bound metal-dependent hydrolase YbcI (DUF457 family)
MMAATHRLVSGSTALVLTSVVGLPVAVAAPPPPGGVAALSASWPDDVEKPLRLPHRGPSHWPSVQAVVLALPVLAASVWLPVATAVVAALAAAAWLGCVAHSCADAMTVHPSGIKLLWPLRLRGYHLLPWRWRVRVGSRSRSEWIFFVVWSGIVLCYLYARYHQVITQELNSA